MKGQRPVHVAELVSRFMAKREGQPKRPSEGLALKVFSVFSKIGPPISLHANAVFFRSGILTLRVSDSSWLTELTFLRPEIEKRINQVFGRPVVTEIRMQLGNPRPQPRRRRAQAPRLSEREQAKMLAWSEYIKDEKVRAAMLKAVPWSLTRGPPAIPLAKGPPGPALCRYEVPPPALNYGFGKRTWDRYKA